MTGWFSGRIFYLETERPDQNCIFKQYVVAHYNVCVQSMTLPKNSQPFINLFYYYFCVVALHQDWLPETIISWNSICVCVFFLNWILFFDLCLCVCVYVDGGGAVTYFLLLCAWSSQSQRLCFSNAQEFFFIGFIHYCFPNLPFYKNGRFRSFHGLEHLVSTVSGRSSRKQAARPPKLCTYFTIVIFLSSLPQSLAHFFAYRFSTIIGCQSTLFYCSHNAYDLKFSALRTRWFQSCLI